MKIHDRFRRICGLIPPPQVQGEFLLLGYSLLLSPSEEEILRRCIHVTEQVIPVTKKPFSSLVSRINRKASAINGRGLIQDEGGDCKLRPFL
jgi:hypothetical protein